jgi:heat-inducible transcriptional repressor
VGRASEILSGITSLASVVMFPRRESTVLRQIEFLPLADRRVLVILVTNEQEVQNQIIETQRDYSASELEQAGHYLTESFSGQDLPAIRSLMLEELQDAREHLNQLMLDALEIGRQAFDETAAADDYVVSGETNLMQFDDLADMERLRQLFESFRAKHEILRLLEACMSTERAHIFIGEESGYDVFDECSVVTAPYSREGRIVGILGVIGPTRMEYQKVIPLVDLTAKLVGAALKSR